MLRLLERLEVSPSATFAEQDLLRDAAEGFEYFRSLGLLRLVDEPTGSFRCMVQGAAYIAKRDGDDFIAIEAEEREPEVVRLTEAQVRQWTADLPAIARLVQRENGLVGPTESISERLWFLGQLDDGSAVLLGLFRDLASLEVELTALSSRFQASVSAFLVVCPTTRVPSFLQARLQKDQVRVVNLNERTGMKLPLGASVSSTSEGDFVVNSPDYRSVTMRGRPFRLSVRRAKVVMILHRARSAGQKELAWSTIKTQLEALPNPFYVKRMQDIFKDMDGWEELVTRTAPGYYSLNL